MKIIIRRFTPIFALAAILFSVPGYGGELVPFPVKQPVRTVLSAQDSTAALEYLNGRLDGILQAAGLSSARKSLYVYSLDKQTAYYERQSKATLTPASTTKLFSTFTAFHRLGADGTISTKIFTDAKDIENGVVHGNLYIVGHGDALLSISDIETIADKLAALGIKKIEGGIYADGSYFDAITERHIYSGDDDVVEPLPPITALGMSRNSVNVIVNAGNPPRVQTIPPSDAFRIITAAAAPQKQVPGTTKKQSVPPKASVVKKAPASKKIIVPQKASTAKKKSKTKTSKRSTTKKPAPKRSKKAVSPQKKRSPRKMGAWPVVPEYQRYGDASPLPPAPKRNKKAVAAPRVNVQSRINDSGIQEFVVSGNVRRGGMYSAAFVMKNPELVVAGALRNRLISGGIAVGGGIGRRVKPESTMVLTMFERPLTEICAVVNKNSDNFLAEHIFKMIGAHAGGQKNTAKHATEAVKESLNKEGIFDEGLCMADGSGLCRKNLISAATEAGLLEKAAELFGDKFEATLSIAGVDGTLRRRMKSTAAEGNVHAKTGTLRNASALSGYVHTADGEKLVFSFIFNGGSLGQYKQTENALAVALAGFSYADASKPPEPAPAAKPKSIQKRKRR